MSMTETQSITRQNIKPTEKYDVIVVGAGFSGIYQLHKLRKLGFSVLLLDAGADLGGVWHWNCYPGARVDTHVPIYEFSDETLWRNWNWTELYPGWSELREYFAYVDEKWDIRKDTKFNARVNKAIFDDKESMWDLQTENGDQLRSRFVILCTGFAAKPFIPNYEGLETFTGPQTHTALWPQEGLDLAGKRVAVIGTGASAIQVSQEAAKTASHLTVFQRTANFALPMGPRATDIDTQTKSKADYPSRFAIRRHTFGGFDFDFLPKKAMDLSPEQRNKIYDELWKKGGFYPWLGTFEDVLNDKAANKTAYEYWRDRTRARIDDPKTASILAPDEAPYPFGTKRPCLENGFFEIFNQDNVDLVNLRETPIERVTPKGIETKESEYVFDILVMATGFDAVTGGILNIDIRGVKGITLQERWRDGLRTTHGLATAGFPNLLMVYGPQAPTAFLNGPTAAELQGDVVIQCLEYMREKGYKRIESTLQSDQEWADHTNQIASMTLFPEADSWYMGANIPGKKRECLNYPGGLPLYLKKCGESAASGYKEYVLTS